MSWAPLLVGFIMGFTFAGCIGIIIFLGRVPRRRREPVEWAEDFHEPIAERPLVTTRILVNQREINLP